jgi:hypothetical protein
VDKLSTIGGFRLPQIEGIRLHVLGGFRLPQRSLHRGG